MIIYKKIEEIISDDSLEDLTNKERNEIINDVKTSLCLRIIESLSE
jgi:hypothetical protein